MRTTALRYLLLVAVGAAACGDDAPTTDAGPMGTGACMYTPPARNDRLHLGCRGPTGEESAEACARRLATEVAGARVYIAPRRPCAVDPQCVTCAPLCELSAAGSASCTAGAGCPYTFSEGYAVVVEVNGRRWTAAVADGENCPGTAAGRVAYGRLNYADVQSAAACARSLPMGGLGPARFGGCDTLDAACGPVAADACREVMLRSQAGPYTANICSRECGGDSDCGPNGQCSMLGVCVWRCGGPCGIGCAEGFTCSIPQNETEGICLPLPRRN